MTIEEWAKDFKSYVNELQLFRDDYKGIMSYIDDALAILKEQEPKQIIRKQVNRENSDGSISCFAEWYCPHCNMLILRGFNDPAIKFCYRCGKPILWEGWWNENDNTDS